MANTVNKRINIWINGKEVENNIKSVRAAMAQLINEQAKMTIGSDEYVAHSEKIRKLKSVMEEHRNELKATKEEAQGLRGAMKNVIDVAAVTTVVEDLSGAVSKIKDAISEYVEAFAALDDALAGVCKTTGMTTEEVNTLLSSLRKLDTRTSTNDLLKIAEAGGRLAIAKEEIESFTVSVDKANVALGDSFTGGAEEIATVLGKIRNAYKETKFGDVGDAFMRIGSVINELGANTAASEGNIANFTQRVGAMPDVLKPTVQEAMALAAAFEANSVDAEIASRSFGILMKTAASNIGKFAEGMGQTSEALEELINSNPAEFALQFAESMKGMSATETSEYLKKLGLNADGVVKILGALSNSGDQVREMFELANTAFEEATSLTTEFNTVNNNTAAQLDKARRSVVDASAALGESLAPVMIAITNGTANFIRLVGALVKVLMQNRVAVFTLIGAYTTLLVVKSKNLIATKAGVLWAKLEAAATATATTFTNLYALAKAKLTKNTLAAAAAQKALKAAFASTPWGAVITAVVAIGAALTHFIQKALNAKKGAEALSEELKETATLTGDFSKRVGEESRRAEELFGKLDTLEKGTKEYKKVVAEIIEQYPSLLVSQVDERGNLLDIAAAYWEVERAIKDKVAAELMAEKKNDAYSEYIENTKAQFQSIPREYREHIKEFIEFGSEASSILDGLALQFGGGDVSYDYSVYQYAGAVESIVSEFKALRGKLQEIDDAYSIHMKSAAEKTAEAAALSAYNEKKNRVDAAKEANAETVKAWAALTQKTAQLRKEEQEAEMNDWQKTKSKISERYDTLIVEALKFGDRGRVLAEQLEEDKGNAIIKAGQTYLTKYKKMAADFQKEIGEMATRTAISDDQSAVVKELLGDQKAWDAKIEEIQSNVDVLRGVLSEMAPTDANYADFERSLGLLLDTMAAAAEQKAQSAANIVRKYAGESVNFVQNETAAIERARLSQYEREIAAIDERYDAEIEKVNETIAAKRDLIAAGGDAETLNAEIADLDMLLLKIEELRAKAKDAVPRDGVSSSVISSWERLYNVMRMTPEAFAANWRNALQSAAQAFEEFAYAASDIARSINEVMDNRATRELNTYNETQDQKLTALKSYYDQGLYSEKYYNAQSAKIQAEKDKKEREIQREKFVRDKKAAIVEATIKGTLAAIASFAELGFPWGLIPMALSMATTGAQIAAIASQVNPYAKGGWIKQKQLILAGEEGQEWVASNRLLRDDKTRPVINALEEYQRGNTSALTLLRPAEPDGGALYHSANALSRTFAEKQTPPVIELRQEDNNGAALLKELKTMNRYLSDPKNRQAYITRKQQREFEARENELRKYARL